MSKAFLASGEVIRSNALCWKTLDGLGRSRLARVSAASLEAIELGQQILAVVEPVARRGAGGGTMSGTAKSGALGSASMTNGAAAAPR